MDYHLQLNDYEARRQPSKHVNSRSSGQNNGFGSRHPLSSSINLGDIFPCNNPTNPSYENRSTRLQSFKNWPGHIQATPEQLAEAGFFYLDDRDRCKCYYCNGGLQNWDFEDDPWTEHAKYFPRCEFLLQRKGPEYVSNVNAIYPNLQRPGEENVGIVQHQVERNNQTEIPTGASYKQQPVTPERNENELIAEAIQFGYNEELIRNVIKKKKNLSQSSYDGLAALIDDLIKAEESEHLTETMDFDLSPPISITVSDGPVQQVCADNSSIDFNLRRQLESIMDESICKICFENERSCVFTNCGHLCCCFECGKFAQQCPICNAKVTERLRIFKT
ncbi:baculoviral IAP repeat-containing protein 8-like [Styela clava]|uniref:baculoviral IAP repeat-containing protein 2-like n=1 Tax=Styela clava TaxID=7725 RepID=UPI00193AC7C9|nr:baculoviral IAP repeat-containing protein 2-like [Styela clava]